jgi:xanthine dehydrogenase YagS FAD-binding subunit
MRPFHYQHAGDITEALQAVGISERSEIPPTMAATQFLAGGTTILDLMKLDVMQPQRLVDINQIDGDACRIEQRADTFYLGAFATMATVADHPDIKRNFPIVAQSLDLAARRALH